VFRGWVHDGLVQELEKGVGLVLHPSRPSLGSNK